MNIEMNSQSDTPSNGIYIILGEINLLLTNLRRYHKYGGSSGSGGGGSHYDHALDPLTKNFYELKTLLNEHSDLSDIDSSTFLSPFLEIIKSEETTGPVTGMALGSVDKFISYGLISLNSDTTSTCVQQIADSITHARFVGTDPSSDEVVLMKILRVLRTLMLSPIGYYLTNSSVCEIMQSCFQICFETRLTDLLRKTAESMLVDMVQLLFARMPQFKEEFKYSTVKKLSMKSDGNRQKKTKKAKSAEKTPSPSQPQSPSSPQSQLKTIITNNNNNNKVEESTEVNNDLDLVTKSELDQIANSNNNIDQIIPTSARTKTLSESSTNSKQNDSMLSEQQQLENKTNQETIHFKVDDDLVVVDQNISTTSEQQEQQQNEQQSDPDYVNPRGVRFVPDGPNGYNAANVPYGLPCVRELLRFLISLISSKNTEIMISMGLNLLTIGLESGVDHLSSYQSLLAYVKDDLCKNLYNLLSSERLAIYANTLRVSFLLFESLRFHLKLQIEHIFIKLMDIIVSDSNKITQEQKEMTIDFLLQLLRLPGFPTELYLNYDCSLNCTNLFEDLTKLLSKNAFSVQTLLTANSLSLSALLTIIENIDLENSLSSYNSITTEKLNQLMSASLSSIKSPVASGYSAATQSQLKLTSNLTNNDNNINNNGRKIYKPRDSNRRVTRVNRMKLNTDDLPTSDELKSNRIRKRIMTQSVDLFNNSPAKSIQFLKDNNIFSQDEKIFIQQLIKYLKETPMLDKKLMGEYLSNRKHITILEEFVKSFNFANMRIDEALRIFLETFRLPGEAPLISIVMENFAKHWRSSNNNQFANDDSAFTLSYAIIMLNVDQHNHNVKKQSTPMILEEFKKNLSKVDGGANFDEDLLEEIYTAIKTEEIVMPAEHTGVLRDNYLWKVLIRRGRTSEAEYVHAPAGSFNHEIFSIVWGQTISALSFVYDKSLELSVIQKSINGFKKCAQVAAYYMMSDVFDNIVISLCKFTALTNQLDSIDQLSVNFGMNNKAQMACRTMFQLTHSHGDILRDGWKNILDCIVQLYKAKLLPKVLIECEDYLHPKSRILLIKENIPIIQKPEGSGLFSSFFPFMSTDLSSTKGPTPEEQEATKNAQNCVDECHIEQLIHDTKFLRVDSLLELIKALIFLSQINDTDLHLNTNSLIASTASATASGSSGGGSGSGSISSNNTSGVGSFGSNSSNSASGLSHSTSNNNLVVSSTSNMDSKVDIDAAVFSLEILIKVVLQNRDRISCIWTTLRNHFYNIIINANDYSFFLERTVVGLLRISARLLRREEIASEVLASLRMLLMIKKKSIIRKLSRQVAFGIHDLLRNNASNIHSNDDWSNIFTILQVYGAGANAPPFMTIQQQQQAALVNRSVSFSQSIRSKTQSNESLNEYNTNNNEGSTDRGYLSDPEMYQQQVENETPSSPTIRNNEITQTYLANQYKIDLDDEGLGQHDKKAFAKCCETLTFLIRDMAHITLQNFESCIHCLRSFVEACVLGDQNKDIKKEVRNNRPVAAINTKQNRKNQKLQQNQQDTAATLKNDESDEEDQFITSYETISIQLLDLLDTLHTKAASIFTIWAEEQRHISQQTSIIDSVVSNLWSKCWCPILQGIARLSCDTNGEVRMHALQYLQRALLVHELQTLSAMEWEACFNKVLFPLLAKLLENIDPRNAIRMEETRMRASTLLCKVFLQHLTTLARLSTFTALWLTILDYMDKYMKSDKSDLLHDVIPESLKNMLLVMETTGLFNKNNPDIKFSQLCSITKDRIESFLPGLWEDLFKVNNKNNSANKNVSSSSVSPDQDTTSNKETNLNTTDSSNPAVVHTEQNETTTTTNLVNESPKIVTDIQDL